MDPTADTTAMRRAAALLGDRASLVDTVMARVNTQLGSMSYAGPAADQFRALLAERLGIMGQATADMRAMSSLLVQGAMAADAAVGPMGMS